MSTMILGDFSIRFGMQHKVGTSQKATSCSGRSRLHRSVDVQGMISEKKSDVRGKWW
jgi:hypothetical protein